MLLTNGNPFRMYGTEVGILEERYQIILRGLLQCTDGIRLKPIGSTVLGNLANKSLKRAFTNKQLGRLLVTANLS
jgi:hypothetical protein